MTEDLWLENYVWDENSYCLSIADIFIWLTFKCLVIVSSSPCFCKSIKCIIVKKCLVHIYVKLAELIKYFIMFT